MVDEKKVGARGRKRESEMRGAANQRPGRKSEGTK